MDDEEMVARFLAERGFDTVETWAGQSGYWFDKDNGVWYDDDGHGIDIEDALIIGIERGRV
jgi:hypothetical protein